MLKRVLFFLMTNIAVIACVSIILAILQKFFGIDLYGNDISSIAIFALIFGFVGSFISLLLSKFTAKRLMGVKVIENTSDPLYKKVTEMANKLGIKNLEVGTYHSADMNAFATGWSKNNALVAFSTSMLNKMNSDELDGVIAHELAHVKNGDMVTMALITGVVNAFVIFASRIVSDMVKDRLGDSIGWLAYNVLYIGLQIVFGILATPIIMYFSRVREFKADHDAANLVGKNSMIKALKRLKQEIAQEKMNKEMTVLCINDQKSENKFFSLFKSHPDLDDRIERLNKQIVN